MDLASLIRNVPDFPKPGVQFKDVTTILKNGPAFREIIDGWKARYADKRLTAVVGAEARGFIFGSALAYAMGLPFIPVRKKGKLPAETLSQEFDLEYGADKVEIHVDALKTGDRVLLVDDLLATGGTMAAMAALVRQLGAEIVEVAFVVELPFLKGREKLAGLSVHSLVSFEGE
jgi:adenine phosphoribosyltransferase